MAEILPGVYIEVRPEALITGGPISVGNIGIVGTARRGPSVNDEDAAGDVVKVLSSYADAREIFGPYDPIDDPIEPDHPLTLVRALELAYANGASTVFAVRVANTNAARAAPDPTDMLGNATVFSLAAKDPGTWGNDLTVSVEEVSPGNSRVTLKLGNAEEVFLAATGTELVRKINENSNLATATAGADEGDPLVVVADVPFAGGTNGADASTADYKLGLEALTNQNAHIIVSAGLDAADAGADLLEHVQNASTDKVRRDRIAVIGSAARGNDDPSDFLSNVLDEDNRGPSSDRIIYVAPGVRTMDSGVRDVTAPPPAPKEVTLPGAYAAAAIAGMLSARSPHISLTNKALAVRGLEADFNAGQLEQLVLGHVLALEKRRGFRVVKGITTDAGAFQQITTRRIVDFAKFGVRAAAEPYIGLLNNDRVRQALKGSINGFLADMVTDEMIISYELEVTATRPDEIRGVARVSLTLRPTFSIDYIKVVMFLG